MAGQGRAGFSFFQLPSGSIVDEDISAETKVDADKLQHIIRAGADFGLDEDDTPVSGIKTVHIAATPGRIRGFHVTLADDGSATDIDFDLLVNGASVLTAPVNFVNGDGDGVVKAGTFPNEAARTLATDDIVSVQMAVTSATDAGGPYCLVTLEELAA